MSARSLGRREVIVFLGASALAWPIPTHAQQTGAKRRIGVLMNLAADDPEAQARDAAFRQALQKLGWTEGRNVQIDHRWGAGDVETYRIYAAELVALSPDVLLAGGGPVVEPLRRAARAVPIVFTNTNDPITLGYVASLSRPGGNITGFINIEYGISGKWLELLKQISPSVTRAAILWDPSLSGGKAQFAEILRVAPSLQLELSPINLHDPDQLESFIAAFASEGNGGLVVTASTLATLHRKRIIAVAARYRLPAVYSNRLYVSDGGLISYGPDFLDQYRRAADYVDRILNGAKPADLPVEAPRTYETVLNTKTANDLGLKVSRIVLQQANEVLN